MVPCNTPLTKEQIRFLLELIAEKHGPGWSEDKEVAALQAVLSIALELEGVRMIRAAMIDAGLNV